MVRMTLLLPSNFTSLARSGRVVGLVLALTLVASNASVKIVAREQQPASPEVPRSIGPADCTLDRAGSAIAADLIGEPVSAVRVTAVRWTDAAAGPGYCTVDGAIAPVDRAAPDINFRVILPARWDGRAMQLGGGGINGVIPNLTGPIDGGATGPARGVVTYGSDSGHQAGPNASQEWATNDEAIRNLGYMQMKKTHDAAVVIVERVYGARPLRNYYIGTSQGGREALTVAQRYHADYDGIIANVPIVNFSSLMLAPEWIRIQEKPAANWVTRAKVRAIRTEFMRQCDGLDGRIDGVINNYMACRARFDVTQPPSGREPWAAKLCPGDVDPNPADTSAGACLTRGQAATLQMVYGPYTFATPLANGVQRFGMWLPTTDPSGSGLIADVRFEGQEGAPDSARKHAHLGVLGVTGFLMRDLAANPLDYVEGGPLNGRRMELSPWLDATSADLTAFAARGGRMIVTIGTDDTLASPGAQLDYYQSLLDTMGRSRVDAFARLFVLPQANHGLRGMNMDVDGEGRTIPTGPLASSFDKVTLLTDWVERGLTPPMSVTARGASKTIPVCGYPLYPHYVSGPPEEAASYACR